MPTLLYPPLQRSWKGGILVSPCPSVRPSVCPSVDRIVSALYLQQYSSDPFHICTSYQATSEGVSHVMPVSTFKNLKFWRSWKGGILVSPCCHWFQPVLTHYHNDYGIFTGISYFNQNQIFGTGIENWELSWCQLCHHWWYWRLSLWQSPVPPVKTKLVSWWFSVLSGIFFVDKM